MHKFSEMSAAQGANRHPGTNNVNMCTSVEFKDTAHPPHTVHLIFPDPVIRQSAANCLQHVLKLNNNRSDNAVCSPAHTHTHMQQSEKMNYTAELCSEHSARLFSGKTSSPSQLHCELTGIIFRTALYFYKNVLIRCYLTRNDSTQLHQ